MTFTNSLKQFYVFWGVYWFHLSNNRIQEFTVWLLTWFTFDWDRGGLRNSHVLKFSQFLYLKLKDQRVTFHFCLLNLQMALCEVNMILPAVLHCKFFLRWYNLITLLCLHFFNNVCCLINILQKGEEFIFWGFSNQFLVNMTVGKWFHWHFCSNSSFPIFGLWSMYNPVSLKMENCL